MMLVAVAVEVLLGGCYDDDGDSASSDVVGEYTGGSDTGNVGGV